MHNQPGFTRPSMLLVVVLILLIFGAGAYYVMFKYAALQAPNAPISTHSSATNNTSAPTVSRAISAPNGELQPQTNWRPISDLPHSYGGNSWTWYWVNNGAMYCMRDVVPNIDAATFRVSPKGTYAKDARQVYRCSDALGEANPQTFTTFIASDEYARDKNHVYYEGSIISDADPATFELLPSPPASVEYGRDMRHVYDLGSELLNADPQTFTIASSPGGGFYIADKNWVYANDAAVAPASLISGRYAQTLPKNCQYTDTYSQVDPSMYPELYSLDHTVVGYTGYYGAVCVITLNTGTAKYFNPGNGDSFELSRDGSKLFYRQYAAMECGHGGSDCPPCPDCGWHEIDINSGKDTLIPQIADPPILFWNGYSDGFGGADTENKPYDVDLTDGLMVESRAVGNNVHLLVRNLPSKNWEYLTGPQVKNLPIIQDLQMQKPGFYSGAKISTGGSFVDYIFWTTGDSTIGGQHGRLNIKTGQNAFPL